MNEWKLFRHDSERDLEAANALFEGGNYGNAAFHGQQAFEKMIKAAVLKDGTLELTARKMAHIPFAKIYEKRLPAENREGWWEQIDDLSSAVWPILLLNTIKPGGFLHTLFWKMSLNIPMPGLVDDDHLDIPPEYREERVMCLEINPDPRRPRFRHPSSTSSKGETVEFMFSNLYLDKYQFLRQKMKNTSQIDDLLDVVLSFTNLYLLAYPHESLGRYSTSIDGTGGGGSNKNSFELYEIQRLELRKLIDEITSAVTALDKNMMSA